MLAQLRLKGIWKACVTHTHMEYYAIIQVIYGSMDLKKQSLCFVSDSCSCWQLFELFGALVILHNLLHPLITTTYTQKKYIVSPKKTKPLNHAPSVHVFVSIIPLRPLWPTVQRKRNVTCPVTILCLCRLRLPTGGETPGGTGSREEVRGCREDTGGLAQMLQR